LASERCATAVSPAALDTLLDDWRDDAAPRIACGMIGSRQGWIEAPYVECPADLAALDRGLARTPGGELAIVPGARCIGAAGVPDVMRGEETQLVGAIGLDESRVLAFSPARTANGRSSNAGAWSNSPRT
jgi:2-dehydro-3-deoxygalactonokinase